MKTFTNRYGILRTPALKVIFALIMFWSSAYCLDGGPTMPEYSDFESIENTDMVNLATGNFTYTIPIMTVPGPGLGFPIVLGYHANILAKQEASWVGLGWNLQAGAITREVNNLPDDFNGDLVKEEIQSNKRTGWSGSVAYDGVTVGFSYDSEEGGGGIVGIEYGAAAYKIQFNEARFSSSIGVTYGDIGVVGRHLGTLSIGLSIGPEGADYNVGNTMGPISIGVSLNNGFSAGVSLKYAQLSLMGGKLSGSIAGVSTHTNSLHGNASITGASGFIPIPTPWAYIQIDWSHYEYKVNGLAIDANYGFLYSDTKGMDCEDLATTPTIDERYRCTHTGGIAYGGTQDRVKKMEANTSEKPLKNRNGDFAFYTGSAEDVYSVVTQGISGAFKPYRTEDGDYISFLTKKRDTFMGTCDVPVVGSIAEFFGGACTRHEELDFAPLFENGSLNQNTPTSLRNLHKSAPSFRDNIVWRFLGEQGGGLFTDPDGSREDGFVVSASPNKIVPFYSAGKLEAWVITKDNGIKYYYTEPQTNYEKNIKSSVERNGENWTTQSIPEFNYAWLLTAITSPDFVRTKTSTVGCLNYDNGKICLPENGDIGGWVRFTYTEKETVPWESPYKPKAYGLQVASYDYKLKPNAYISISGSKSIGYLSQIETPTHKATFSLGDRLDGHSEANIDQPSSPLKRLNSITLISKVFGKQISQASFAYDYSLARNNIDSYMGNGKLTLLSVTLGAGSNGPWMPPYLFTYGNNPKNRQNVYDPPSQAFDHYGYNCSTCLEHKREPDGTADAWNLAKITSPSGSVIEISYLPRKIKYIEQNPIVFPKDYNYYKTFPEDYFATMVPGENGGPSSLGYYDDILDVKIMNPNTRNLLRNNYTILMGQFDSKDYVNLEFLKNMRLPKPPDKYLIEFPASNYAFQDIDTDTESRYSTSIGYDAGGAYVYIYANKETFEDDGFRDEFSSICGYFRDGWDNAKGFWTKYGMKDDPTLVKATRAGAAVGKTFSSLPYGIWLGGYGIYTDNHDCSANLLLSKHRYVQFRSFNKNNGLVRVWALYAENPISAEYENGFKFGAGVSAEKVSITEPISGIKNVVNYSYDDGVVPTLPPTLSNYRDDFYHNSSTGIDQIVGGSGSVYGKATATFNGKYKESYYFITPQHAPNTYQVAKGESKSDLPISGVNARLEIVDRSSLWGRLWKRESQNASGQIVKTETNSYSVNWGFGNKIFQSDFPAVTGGPEVNADIKVANSTVNEKNYFGVAQTIYSTRQLGIDYFGTGCSADYSFSSYRDCLELNGIFTTQIMKYSASAYDQKNTTIQDNLTSTVETKFQDFLTGIPLVTITNNDYEDAGTQKTNWFVDYKELAYSQYNQVGGMKDENMLSQEFSNSRFVYSSDPGSLTLDEILNTGKIVSASFNKWKDFSETNGYASFRISESFELSNKTGFSLPNKNTNVGLAESEKKWRSLGENYHYDEFGHPDETHNSAGKSIAKVYGYGQGLLVASTVNAKRDEVFYQSFETNEYLNLTLPGYTNQSMSKTLSKTGNSSIKVANCMESTSSGPVLKSECLKPGTSYWKGREFGYFSCDADFSPTFTSYGDCLLHYISRCFPTTYTCEQKSSTPEYYTDKNSVCFSLPRMPANQTYIASAWYYDQFKGSNPTNPTDAAYRDKTSGVTRPGILIGSVSESGCSVEAHPNGGVLDADDATEVIPAAEGDWNANQRAMGGKNWKRIWVELTPAKTCGSSGIMDNAKVCLYASKNKPGSDVVYDEVRVRPKTSLMTTYTYDFQGSMISSADANEVATHYDYDAFGNLTAIRNDNGIRLSEQAKKIGKSEVSYSISQSREYIDGCEVFDLKSNPPGVNSSFKFLSADGGATFEIKTDANGKSVNTLCYDAGANISQMKLLIYGTGRVYSLPIKCMKHPSLVIDDAVTGTLVQHSPNAQFTTTYDGKLYHMAPLGGTYENAFHAFHLPSQSELETMHIIQPGDILDSYKIQFEIANIPNSMRWDLIGDVPTSDPQFNLKHRMHLKYNYFDELLHSFSSITPEFRKEAQEVQLYPSASDIDPYLGRCFGNPLGKCFDIVEYGDLQCQVSGQTTLTNCSSPIPVGYFNLNKTIIWPVSYALTSINSSTMGPPTDNAGYYTGDFHKLSNTQNNFLFGLIRHFPYSGALPTSLIGWHAQEISSVGPKSGIPYKHTNIKITITPVTLPPNLGVDP